VCFTLRAHSTPFSPDDNNNNNNNNGRDGDEVEGEDEERIKISCALQEEGFISAAADLDALNNSSTERNGPCCR